jgi:hypothetical protein
MSKRRYSNAGRQALGGLARRSGPTAEQIPRRWIPGVRVANSKLY